MWWFFGSLGLSLVVAWIGSRLKPKSRVLHEDAYYQQVARDCLDYAERLYQKR